MFSVFHESTRTSSLSPPAESACADGRAVLRRAVHCERPVSPDRLAASPSLLRNLSVAGLPGTCFTTRRSPNASACLSMKSLTAGRPLGGTRESWTRACRGGASFAGPGWMETRVQRRRWQRTEDALEVPRTDLEVTLIEADSGFLSLRRAAPPAVAHELWERTNTGLSERSSCARSCMRGTLGAAAADLRRREKVLQRRRSRALTGVVHGGLEAIAVAA